MALQTGATAHPPPSTLAAQLVFSASTRSSRSEDHNELRRLSATIQAVERDPNLLKTPQDQLDHNHLLTYVFIRAVLDGIRLEDPILDPNTIRNEVLKATNFLRLIVKETPHVLAYTSVKGEEYDLRGAEPLWIWLLPKLLRFLGHKRCLDVTDDIHGFFLDLLALLGPHGDLGDLSVAIVSYLRQALDGPCHEHSRRLLRLT
jgi:serine/threonine-protein kinase ATR